MAVFDYFLLYMFRLFSCITWNFTSRAHSIEKSKYTAKPDLEAGSTQSPTGTYASTPNSAYASDSFETKYGPDPAVALNSIVWFQVCLCSFYIVAHGAVSSQCSYLSVLL